MEETWNMNERGASLADIQAMPRSCLMLLAGLPGAGKSTFCHDAVLNGLTMDRPVILVTTDQGPAEVIDLLEQRGLAQHPPGSLWFVDAFGETVGATAPSRPDTVGASCEDLNSITMAIARLEKRIDRKDILLAFDSLTSPYLFNKEEIFRFVRLCLAKFATEGSSVLALVDEGCGKEEDLGAMMSVADGILRMEMKDGSRTLHVVKHPRVEPVEVEVPIEPRQPQVRPPTQWDPDVLAQFTQSSMKGKPLRGQVGDFVHLFWPNLAHWSCMLWDPKGFPIMLYELNRYETATGRSALPAFPWRQRLVLKMFDCLQGLGVMPRSLSRVKDMKRLVNTLPFQVVDNERSGILKYLEDLSQKDEHAFRVYENSDCVGFEKIGASIASYVPPMIAGLCEMIEGNRREWNAIETKCLGLGDPYCEFKLVPGEIHGLKDSLRKDTSLVERIHERLMEHLMGFLLDGSPLVERPRLGSDVHLHVVVHGMGYLNLAGERYRRAQMMGAARSAKMIGERLIEAGLSEDEAIARVLGFLNHCKVGKVTLRPGPSTLVGTGSGQAVSETVRISENCEALRTTIFEHRQEPSCFFTTGFLNGLFSAVKNQHVREIKCVAAGDPYCEWEII
jgi:predicted hydrocarbon binding protein/KaiC/GvpD/RAD55 family RecA-like ATPase